METTGTDMQKQGQNRGNGPLVHPGDGQGNEALMRKMFNVLNERSAGKMLPFLADNVTIINTAVNKTYQGHAGFSEYLNNYITAFPDYRL